MFVVIIIAAVECVSTFTLRCPNVVAFSSNDINFKLASLHRHNGIFYGRKTLKHLYSNIIDVEFSKEDDDGSQILNSGGAETLLDYSLNMDPEWKDIPVRFIDTESAGKNKYIDCKLAFLIEMDGVEYSIAVPCETQVGVVCEGSFVGGNPSHYLDSDDEENIELMEIAAAQFAKEFGEELKIKRTPRTLTVEGDLESITKDWSSMLDSQNIKTEQLLDDEDEDDKFIDDFFRRELGANYREEFLIEDKEIDDEVEKISGFFNIPGVGTEVGDVDGIDELFNEIESGADIEKAKEYELSNENTGDSTLRLLSFQGPDQNYYSLVQMLKPVILVGREDPDVEAPKRVLLTKDMADQIIPRLESQFKEELDAVGINL